MLSLESKLKEVENELKREKEAHEKEKEGFVSPGEISLFFCLRVLFETHVVSENSDQP